MSALSFKINAETDKLKSFITMLERLRQVLAEIPDSTKEFDVINRKIGEMEARVEQTMRKIAQMEQQAMDAASKAAASATTGTAAAVLRQEQRQPRPKLRHTMTCLVS
jgi:hypothetical protein